MPLVCLGVLSTYSHLAFWLGSIMYINLLRVLVLMNRLQFERVLQSYRVWSARNSFTSFLLPWAFSGWWYEWSSPAKIVYDHSVTHRSFSHSQRAMGGCIYFLLLFVATSNITWRRINWIMVTCNITYQVEELL